MNLKNVKICVVGLGYVGLPLAVEFGTKYETVGFDINDVRVKELNLGVDSTLEISSDLLNKSNLVRFTSNPDHIKSCNVYIVTVPTPIDKNKMPDLTPLQKASEMLGKYIDKNDIVIYESTVYPGATEEVCLPIIEKESGFKYNVDFFAGYSPERINPGDKVNTLTKIVKVTSGSTAEVANFVDELYRTIIVAGTFKATSIKVAEAAKVIENVQRDVNIALVNELHQIFNCLDINTSDVINAAATKWNFMKLMPGLVGGHCIGVDPYYLLHKSQTLGYIPDLMRLAREINDGMIPYLSNDFLLQLIKRRINTVDLKVLILGFTFKENCPDVRNTKVVGVYKKLVSLGFDVKIYDPWANVKNVYDEYGIEIMNDCEGKFDVGFLAVGHQKILDDIKENKIKFLSDFIYDFKGFLIR